MLIVCNGAPKTGSTWVRHIVSNIIKYNDIPEDYTNKAWGPIGEKRSIAPYKLKEFLNKADYSKRNYLSKNHFYDEATYLLLDNNPEVKIFCIERELKDVVVSYYYHQLRKENISIEFDKYYWRYGRYFVQFMLNYQKIWHQKNKKVYVSSYQNLKSDFNQECTKIANFLNIELSENQINEIKQDTSMDSMRKKWGEADKSDDEVKFFRKGEVGDWENHFTETILDDYNKIIEGGLNGIDYIKYIMLYPIRLKLLHSYQKLYYSIKG